MKKIAILETKDSVDEFLFDKVISFSRDKYVNVDNYIKFSDLPGIYDKAYSSVQQWLEWHHHNKTFFFKDVDLARAFGKEIFELVYNIYQRIYVVNRIVDKESISKIYIEKVVSDDLRVYPFLSEFLSELMPDKIQIEYFRNVNLKVNPKSVNWHWTDAFTGILNIYRRLGNIFIEKKLSNILIDSDLEKIQFVVKNKGRAKSVMFLRDELPQRYLFSLMKNNVRLVLYDDFKVNSIDVTTIDRECQNMLNRLFISSQKLQIDGMDFTLCIKHYLQKRWKNILADVLRKIYQAHYLFRNNTIDALLVDEDIGVYKNLLVQVAKTYKCESYVNCHGELFHIAGYMPLSADNIFVWGNKQKDILSKWGLEQNRIKVVGCSKYDKYLKSDEKILKEKVCDDLGLIKNKPICLIAPCPFKYRRNLLENTFWEEIKNAISVINEFKNDVQIVIKLHPGDDNEPYVREFIKSIGADNIVLIKKYDPLLLAKAVDIIAVYASTFCIDGLAYAKAVILLDDRSIKRYSDSNFFYDGTTPEKIKALMGGILDGGYTNHKTHWSKTADYYLNGSNKIVSKEISKIIFGDVCQT